PQSGCHERRGEVHVTSNASPTPPDQPASPLGGGTPDPWGMKRVENLITGLTGVLSARAVVTPLGEGSEVHVHATSRIRPARRRRASIPCFRTTRSRSRGRKSSRPSIASLCWSLSTASAVAKPNYSPERVRFESPPSAAPCSLCSMLPIAGSTPGAKWLSVNYLAP